MTTVAEMHKKGFAEAYKEKFKEAFTHDWYFSGWEKLVILVSFLWTVYSVFKFLGNLI